MPTIKCRNKKLSCVVENEPVWAPYRGFSLLFDNPSCSLSRMHCGLQQITCPLNEPGLELYTGLAEALNVINATGSAALTHHGLYFLPSYSYHVTLWDGMNDDNTYKVRDATARAELEQFLGGFPATVSTRSGFTDLAARSGLLRIPGQLDLRFGKLSTWGKHEVLVAKLVPAHPRDEDVLSRLKEARSMLYADLFEQFEVGEQACWSADDSCVPDLDEERMPAGFLQLLTSDPREINGQSRVVCLRPGEKWRIGTSYEDGGKPRKTYVAWLEKAAVRVCRQRGYDPHVTLGYFCDPNFPSFPRSDLDRWTEQIVSPAVYGSTIKFETASLYGFTDMKTYFKL